MAWEWTEVDKAETTLEIEAILKESTTMLCLSK